MKVLNNNYTEKLQKMINRENITILIGILTILVVLWLLFYIIPNFFVSLFDTTLGNIILLLVAILVSYKNYKYGIILGITIIILYRFSIMSKKNVKEGFTWSQDSINHFIELQHTINPNVIFDAAIIQKQATQEDVDYFLKNGKWPWSEKVIELYKEAVSQNPYIRTDPQDAVNQARTVYNEKAILEIISWQTKEGKFLLNGLITKNSITKNSITKNSENQENKMPSEFGINSGIIDEKNDTIVCNMDTNGNSTLVKTQYENGKQTKINVDVNNLENMIPGFSFLNGPCNPCVALNSPPSYTCPFTINEKNNDQISSIWKYLWNTNFNLYTLEDL